MCPVFGPFSVIFGQFLFGQNLPKINGSVAIGVIHSEDVFLEFISVRVRVALSHHLAELLLADFAVRVLGEEILILAVHLLPEKRDERLMSKTFNSWHFRCPKSQSQSVFYFEIFDTIRYRTFIKFDIFDGIWFDSICYLIIYFLLIGWFFSWFNAPFLKSVGTSRK